MNMGPSYLKTFNKEDDMGHRESIMQRLISKHMALVEAEALLRGAVEAGGLEGHLRLDYMKQSAAEAFDEWQEAAAEIVKLKNLWKEVAA